MTIYIPVALLLLALVAAIVAACFWRRRPSFRVKAYHRLMRWAARKHYLAARQAADADLLEINRYVKSRE